MFLFIAVLLQAPSKDQGKLGSWFIIHHLEEIEILPAFIPALHNLSSYEMKTTSLTLTTTKICQKFHYKMSSGSLVRDCPLPSVHHSKLLLHLFRVLCRNFKRLLSVTLMNFNRDLIILRTELLALRISVNDLTQLLHHHPLHQKALVGWLEIGVVHPNFRFVF